MRARGAHLVVLVRRHGYEIRFGENVSPERAIRQLEDVVSPHNVEAGLILVHGVEYGLQHTVGTRTSQGQPAPRLKCFWENVVNRIYIYIYIAGIVLLARKKQFDLINRYSMLLQSKQCF